MFSNNEHGDNQDDGYPWQGTIIMIVAMATLCKNSCLDIRVLKTKYPLVTIMNRVQIQHNRSNQKYIEGSLRCGFNPYKWT